MTRRSTSASDRRSSKPAAAAARDHERQPLPVLLEERLDGRPARRSARAPSPALLAGVGRARVRVDGVGIVHRVAVGLVALVGVVRVGVVRVRVGSDRPAPRSRRRPSRSRRRVAWTSVLLRRGGSRAASLQRQAICPTGPSRERAAASAAGAPVHSPAGGPLRVPGQGALQAPRDPGLGGPARDDAARRRARRPTRSAARSSSRRRCSPAGAARPAASSWRTPRRRPQRHAEAILGMDINGHVVRRVWIETRLRHREGVLPLGHVRPRARRSRSSC